MPRDPKYDPLFEPIRIGPKRMKNRFYQTPHANHAGSDFPGADAAFRAVRAEGGWGAVNTGWCSIGPESDATSHLSARLWDEDDVRNLRHLCDRVHEHGALIGVELGHLGVYAPCCESRAVPCGPSAYPSDVEPWVYCAEFDEDEIASLIERHVEAARRALEAGFDIVYFWPADSMLGIQFLAPFFNKRVDGYGGSFDNRIRFSLELLEATRKAVGHSCAVATRFSVDAILGPGMVEAGDEGLKYVERLSREGLVDLWDIKIGSFADWGEDIPTSRFEKANHELPFVKDVKSVAGRIPVVCVGRLTSPDDMVANLTRGVCDIVGAARASIADPFLPKKVEEGRLDDIRECIGCNMCIASHESHAFIACTQNATAMEEYRRGWHPERFEPAEEPCSVLVIGAGPAGMECARVLGLRGYEVHLREADAEIGGHVRNVQRYPGLSEWGRIITYREAQLGKLKTVEVHKGVGEMSAEAVLRYGADRVVLAVGARWATDGFSSATMAAIEGIDAARPQFLTPEQVMAGKEVGDRVVVIEGEGLSTGYSMAVLMADRGKQVTIVTQLDTVAPYTLLNGEFSWIQRTLHEKNIRELTRHWIAGVSVGNTVELSTFYLYRDSAQRTKTPRPGEMPRQPGTETTKLECDSVILCTSRVSNTALYKALKARKAEWEKAGIKATDRIGDCHAPRLIHNAIFDGHRLAREFDSPDPQRPLPYIRERQVWGARIDPRHTGA